MQPLLRFRPLVLLSRTALVEAVPGRVCAVQRLRFALPGGDAAAAAALREYDLGLGDRVKLYAPGARKAKSYSPTDVGTAGGVEITVKIYPGGRNSAFLDRLRVGETAPMSGPWPPRPVRMKRRAGRKVCALAFGIGITEAFHVARAELAKGDAQSVTLLYANRHVEDGIYAAELAAMEAAHGGRFRLVRIYSRDAVDGALRGRVDAAVLGDVFGVGAGGGDAAPEETRFLVVGSKPMMRGVWGMLRKMGYDEKHHALLLKQLQRR
jgi:ferredoxin-NADP reductase